VKPPSDKVNNSVFHLQNERDHCIQVSIFKVPVQTCTISGTIKCRNILNMPVTSF